MRAVDIIYKKREGQALTQEEISFLVKGFTSNEIPDYQMSAFLMACFFNPPSFKEATYLTKSMLYSGKIFDFSTIPFPKVDKHSTGGVGDKTSLIIAPIVASYDVAVPMISGRGLGHTGGTLDKLESIPGFKMNLTFEEFQDNLIDAITHLEAMSAFIASGQGISSSNPREQAENQRRAKLQQQFLDELATRLEVVRDRIITAGGAKARGETGAKTDWILDTDRQRVENKNEEWRNWYLYQYAYVSDHQGEAMAKRFLHETAQDFMIRYYDSNAKSTWTEGTSFIGLALACLDFGRTRKLDYLKK